MNQFHRVIFASSLLCASHLPVLAAETFQLSTLNGTKGFTLFGEDSGDNFGRTSSGAGDVNGDGLPDFIIGAFAASGDSGISDIGVSYVVFGTTAGFPANLTASSLNGSDGFRIAGENQTDRSGRSVSGAGDFNADGIDDLIIGAYGNDPNSINGAGEAYILFGQTQPFPAVVNLSTINGTNGLIFSGSDEFGRISNQVSGAGDINGDGFDDVLIGSFYAPYYSSGTTVSRTGRAHVVFGFAGPNTLRRDLSNLNGNTGFSIQGINVGDRLGSSLSGAGDVNGDGIDDILIGAMRAGGERSGQAYLIFGKTAPFQFNATFDLTTLNGDNGVIFSGTPFSYTGVGVAGIGDFNGDGFADVAIGQYNSEGLLFNAGVATIVFGKSQFSSPFALTTIDGTNGFHLRGEISSDRLGAFLGGAGDTNGDGFADVLITALGAGPTPNSFQGSVYHIFGRNGVSQPAFPASTSVENLTAQQGRVLVGEAPLFLTGYSVSTVGDTNGDGFSDFIIGAAGSFNTPGNLSGKAYVLFGESTAATGTSATYKSYAKAGNAPEKGIGIVGDGSNDSFPDSRVLIDFASGENISLQTVTLKREKPESSESLPNPAGIHWQITTDRTPSSGTVTVRFLESEIEGLFKNELNLYTATTISGPWTQVTTFTDQNLNPGILQNTLTASLPNLNTFIAICDNTPPVVNNESDLWVFLGE